MRNYHRLTSSVLSIFAAGCVLVGVSSTGLAQASSGPMCSQVLPDQCQVETFAGATSGFKGTSWSHNGWDFDIFNYDGSTQIDVDTSYTDFGTAVRLGCNTTRIEFPDDLSVRYVTFPIDGDLSGQGWMEVLAVDANGQILDQTFRYNEQAHGQRPFIWARWGGKIRPSTRSSSIPLKIRTSTVTSFAASST